MGICWMAQETQTEDLYQPRGVALEGRWEEGRQKEIKLHLNKSRFKYSDPQWLIHVDV